MFPNVETELDLPFYVHFNEILNYLKKIIMSVWMTLKKDTTSRKMVTHFVLLHCTLNFGDGVSNEIVIKWDNYKFVSNDCHIIMFKKC